MAPSIECGFAELIAKTNYSFLQGASHPEEMVAEATRLGYQALAVTDSLGVYGAPRAHVAAKQLGIDLIIGAEVPIEGTRAVLLAKNRAGYGNLCELLTQAHFDRDNPHLTWEKFFPLSQDLFLLLPAWKLDEGIIPLLKDSLKENLVFFTSHFIDGSDAAFLQAAETYTYRWKLPCIASNQPLFHESSRKPLQDVLSCIRNTCTLPKAGLNLLPNAERYLKSRAQMQALFSSHPEWVHFSVEIAQACRFSLDEIRYRYPTEWIPEGETGTSYLRKLAWQGAQKIYGNPLPDKIQNLLHYEFELIEELGYSDYFLTIWDIVCFARSQNILCQGRGSAANSLVCYVLGITAIDPAHLDLLFERFISRERREPPDIDIDFEHERREEVIQYIYRRYGRHRAAITAEVISFRRKSALREVAKVFEIPLEAVERIQAITHRKSLSEVKEEELTPVAPQVTPRKLSQYLKMARAILSFPRHLGTHVGGFVLCQDPLNRNVPIEKAAMPDRTIVQWDKNDLDALGFVRVDILGLGILTATRKAFQYIQETRGIALTINTLPQEDPKVYDQICTADTVGVFQIESRAQMNMLPRLKPRCFYDLVVEISLVRPGPIQGDMVHPYLKRRKGEEPIEYAHPKLESILKKTYGVPLFQEQVMKMAVAVGGFTPGRADELRRAMGSWRRDGSNRLARLGEEFRQGLVRNGVTEIYAEKIFKQIEGFAEYGFPESHAASFAVLVYATAFLKRHFPDAFLAGLLNAQPMGFYSAHSLIADGIRHGVQIEGINVANSQWDNHLTAPMQLCLGFRQIRGLRQRVAQAIEEARRENPFQSFEDFTLRVGETLRPVVLTKRDLFLLAGAGAFACLGMERRLAFWNIQSLALEDSYPFSPLEPAPQLPPETEWERISADYKHQGVCLSNHPMAFFRPWMKEEKIFCSQDLKQGSEKSRVKVAGIAICRQMPPTASGVLFITLEDEFGFINLVIWKSVFEKYQETLLTQSFLVCEGKIQRTQGTQVLHIIVDKASALLDQQQEAPQVVSHDFR